MNTTQILRRLALSELNCLTGFIDLNNDTGIATEHLEKFINYVNDALREIHAKAPIRKKQLILNTITPKTQYKLHSDYSAVGSDFDYNKYINDTHRDPFNDDIYSILNVFDMCGTPIRINDENSCCGVFVLNSNTIQISPKLFDKSLIIIYQAKHPEVTQDTLNNDLEIADYLVPVIENYISYKVYLHSGSSDSMVKSQSYYAIYKEMCDKIEYSDLNNISYIYESESKFNNRGFV